MIVDAKQVSFRIYNTFSLKDKRSVIKSMLNKVSNKYAVSISEIADHDVLNKGVVGIAIVSNSSTHNKKVLDSVIHFIDTNYEIEIITIENYY